MEHGENRLEEREKRWKTGKNSGLARKKGRNKTIFPCFCHSRHIPRVPALARGHSTRDSGNPARVGSVCQNPQYPKGAPSQLRWHHPGGNPPTPAQIWEFSRLEGDFTAANHSIPQRNPVFAPRVMNFFTGRF